MSTLYKIRLIKVWPPPMFVRIELREKKPRGIRVRYRVYPTPESEDYMLRSAYFSTAGIMLSDEEVSKKIFKTLSNANRPKASRGG